MMTWKANPSILGMSVLSVSPGFSASFAPENRASLNKAIVESAVIATIAAHLTKSWWPIAAPLLFLGFSAYWNNIYGTDGI